MGKNCHCDTYVAMRMCKKSLYKRGCHLSVYRKALVTKFTLHDKVAMFQYICCELIFYSDLMLWLLESYCIAGYVCLLQHISTFLFHQNTNEATSYLIINTCTFLNVLHNSLNCKNTIKTRSTNGKESHMSTRVTA